MRVILGLAAAAALAGCTTYDDDRSDRYRYEGSDWSERRGSPLTGPGADRLDPWLSETEEGWAILRNRWTRRGGWIDEEGAERANIWFRRFADVDGDLCLTD